MEFNEAYIRLRERLFQFQELQRETGTEVPDEQLPAYEPQIDSSITAAPPPPPPAVPANVSGAGHDRSDSSASRRAPDEPPPNYDEAQAQQLSMRLEDHIREGVDRGEQNE